MSDNVNQPGKPLFSGETALQESLIERYEEAWRCNGRPDLDQFLTDSTGQRVAGLVELVHVDLECRLKRGDSARVEEYLGKYPELATNSEATIDLIGTEFEMRVRSEPDLSISEFCDRFPYLAEELRENLVAAGNCSEFQTASHLAAGEETITGKQRAGSLNETLVGNKIRDYRIIQKIGEGGMGSVYRALHERLGKTVAVKVLPDVLLQDREAAARFDREMRAVGKLDHPNIVRATDAGEAAGRHFLVMEFVNGVDLGSLTRRLGKLPIAEACEIIRQASLGLQHIHEHGLVHRDIKPSNVMIAVVDQQSAGAESACHTQTCVVKLLDLGLARLHEPTRRECEQPLTATGQLLGTFEYMAPEQTMGGEVDIRADIYSLGSTLYRLLAGRAPFGGDEYATPALKIIALAQQEPSPIRELRDDVPDRLAAAIDQVLAKDPEERIQTPAEFAKELAPFCEVVDLGELLESAPGAECTAGAHVDHTDDPADAPVSDVNLKPVHSTEVGRSQHRKTGHHTNGSPLFSVGQSSAMALSLIVVLLIATVIYVKTDHGTLVVKADAGFDVSVANQVITIRETESGREFTVGINEAGPLASGKYEIRVEDNAGLSFNTDNFEITRGGSQLLLVELKERQNRVPELPSEFTEVLGIQTLVTRPVQLAGAGPWTVDTVAPRGAINEVSFNPAGNLFAVASDDGSVRLFKPDGSLDRILIAHNGSIRALAWSPDGQYLASVSGIPTQQCMIHIWDLAKSKRVHTFKEWCLNPPDSLQWHPDPHKQQLAIGGSGGNLPCIWDLKAGERLRKIVPEGKTGTHNTLSWSYDGKLLVVAGVAATQIEIRDGENYQLLSRLPGDSQDYRNCIWSPTATKLAFVSQMSRSFRIWEFHDPRKPNPVQIPSVEQIDGLHHSGKSVWSPDGKVIAFARNRVRWPIVLLTEHEVTLLCKNRADDHFDTLSAATWKGDRLVTASNAGLRIWNTKTREFIRHIPVFGPTLEQAKLSGVDELLAVYPLQPRRGGGFINLASSSTSIEGWGSRFAWSQQGRRLIVNGDGGPTLHEYDDATTHVLQDLPIDRGSALSLSPDDGMLVTRKNETYSLWSKWAQTTPQQIELAMEQPIILNPHVAVPQWSTSGEFIATPYYSAVIVWNTATGVQVARYETDSGSVTGFALSPTGNRVFMLHADGRFKIHGSEKSRPFQGHAVPTPARIHWTKDGRRVYSAGTNGELVVVDIKQSKSIDVVKIPFPIHGVQHIQLAQMQFSADGEQLMVAGAAAVTFWASRTGAPSGAVLTDGTFIGPTGHFRPASDKTPADFVYIVEMSDGQLVTLTHREMSQRFSWRNMPEKAGTWSTSP